MIKQTSILSNIKYTFYVLLFSFALMKNNSFAQYYQYPIIDSIKVIPENPVSYVDIVKTISYTNHIRSNCQLVNKLWSWSANDNRFIFNLDYTTNTNSISCFSVDTASLISPPAGTYDLIVAIKVFSNLDTIVDTLVTSFVMIEEGLHLNQESDFERLQIYPNPVNNKLNFNFDASVGNIQLEIYDIAGRKINDYSFADSNNENQNASIDVSALNKGLYFCKFSSENQQITRKFLKN